MPTTVPIESVAPEGYTPARKGKTVRLADVAPDDYMAQQQPAGLLGAVKQVASDAGSGLVKGLKSGAVYKGYFDQPSPGLAAPTPEEQAYFQQYKTLPPAPAQPDPDIIAGTAESLGSIVGKLPEMAVGAAAGSLAGPVGTVVGGTASMGGITELADPNATPASVLKATGTGALEGALMEAGGVVGGKVLGGAASRIMGAGEQVAAYQTAQKAAANALKAFRVAPTAETKTAAIAAQKAAETAYTAIPMTVRAAQGVGKFTGSTIGMGSAPLAHLQLPTIKNYEDAFALTATLHAVGGIKAVRAARRELTKQQAAGAPPDAAMEAALQAAQVDREALLQSMAEQAPVAEQTGPAPFPDVPEVAYKPKTPGSAVLAPEQLPAVPNESGTPFPSVPGEVPVFKPSEQPTNLRTMTRQAEPAPVVYKRQYLLDMLNQLTPEEQNAWLDRALTRTGDQPPAPTGRVTGVPDMQTGAEPVPMQRAETGPNPIQRARMGETPNMRTMLGREVQFSTERTGNAQNAKNLADEIRAMSPEELDQWAAQLVRAPEPKPQEVVKNEQEIKPQDGQPEGRAGLLGDGERIQALKDKQEIWKKTRDEFIAQQKQTAINPHWAEAQDPEWLSGWEGNQRIEHRNAVRAALVDGKPIPDTVKAEYPELVKKYGAREEPGVEAAPPATDTPDAPKQPWEMTREEYISRKSKKYEGEIDPDLLDSQKKLWADTWLRSFTEGSPDKQIPQHVFDTLPDGYKKVLVQTNNNVKRMLGLENAGHIKPVQDYVSVFGSENLAEKKSNQLKSDESIASQSLKDYRRTRKFPGIKPVDWRELSSRHREAVENMLIHKRAVDDSVLADYPDLVDKYLKGSDESKIGGVTEERPVRAAADNQGGMESVLQNEQAVGARNTRGARGPKASGVDDSIARPAPGATLDTMNNADNAKAVEKLMGGDSARSKKIDDIVAASELSHEDPQIVETRKLKGTDGNWYRANGFPFGVKSTGETRSDGFVFTKDGSTTFAPKHFSTREEAQAFLDAARDERINSFRDALNTDPYYTSEKLDEQLKFHEEQAAKKGRLNKPVAPDPKSAQTGFQRTTPRKGTPERDAMEAAREKASDLIEQQVKLERERSNTSGDKKRESLTKKIDTIKSKVNALWEKSNGLHEAILDDLIESGTDTQRLAAIVKRGIGDKNKAWDNLVAHVENRAKELGLKGDKATSGDAAIRLQQYPHGGDKEIEIAYRSRAAEAVRAEARKMLNDAGDLQSADRRILEDRAKYVDEDSFDEFKSRLNSAIDAQKKVDQTRKLRDEAAREEERKLFPPESTFYRQDGFDKETGRAKNYAPVLDASAVKIKSAPDGIEFFTHRIGEKAWAVTESSTGARVSTGATKAAAIKNAVDKIESVGPDKFTDMIKSAREKFGTTPRFDALTPKEPPTSTTLPRRVGELRQTIKSAHEPKVIVAKDPAGMLEAADYLLTKDLPRNQMARVRKIKAEAERQANATPKNLDPAFEKMIRLKSAKRVEVSGGDPMYLFDEKDMTPERRKKLGYDPSRARSSTDSGFELKPYADASGDPYARGFVIVDRRETVSKRRAQDVSRTLPPTATTDLHAAVAQATQWAADIHERLKPHFARIAESAKSVAQFVRNTVKEFGERVRPFVKRFIEEERGAAMNPVRWFEEYRQGRKDRAREAKAEIRDAKSETAAEGREATREAVAAERAKGEAATTRAVEQTQRAARKSESATAKQQYNVGVEAQKMARGADKQALDKLVAEVRKITTPKEYDRRYKALVKALKAKNTAGFDRIVERMRTEVTHARAVDRLQKTLDELPRTKAAPEVLEAVAKLKADAQKTVQFTRKDGTRYPATIKRKFLLDSSVEKVAELQQRADQILQDHYINSKEIADRLKAERDKDDQLAVDDVKQAAPKEHGKEQKQSSVIRLARRITTHPLNIVEEVARRGTHTFNRLFGDLDKAVEKRATIQKQLTAAAKARFKDAGLDAKTLESITKEEVTHSGVKMTKGERVNILLHLMDPDTRASLMRKDQKGLAFSRGSNVRRLKMTPELAMEIEKSATKPEIDLANALFGWANGESRDAVNEWSRGMFGYDIFNRTDHWPRRRLLTDKEPAMNLHGNDTRKAYQESVGLLKPREGGNSPIIVDDALTQFTHLLGTHSNVIGLTEASVNARRLMASDKFQQAVKAHHQDGALLLRDIQRGIDATTEMTRQKTDDFMPIVRRVGRGLAAAKLAVNIPVIISQPFSTLSAGKIIPFKHVAKSFGKWTWDKTAEAEIRKHSAELEDIIDGTGYDVINPGSSETSVALRRVGVDTRGVGDKMMSAVQHMNDVAVFQIWNAAKAWGKEKGLEGDALMKFTAENARQAWMETQPSSNPLYQPGIKLAARTNSAAYALSMFTSQSAIQWNDAVNALREVQNGTNKNLPLAAWRMARPLVVQGIIFNLAKYGYDEGMKAIFGTTAKQQKKDEEMSPAARAAYKTLFDIAGSAPGANAFIDAYSGAAQSGFLGKGSFGISPSTPIGDYGGDVGRLIYDLARSARDGEFKPSLVRDAAALGDVMGVPLEQIARNWEWWTNLQD